MILRPIYQNEFAEVIDHFGCVSPVFPFTAFTVVRGAASADGDAVSPFYTCAFLFTAPLNYHQTLFLINYHDGCISSWCRHGLLASGFWWLVDESFCRVGQTICLTSQEGSFDPNETPCVQACLTSVICPFYV